MKTRLLLGALLAASVAHAQASGELRLSLDRATVQACLDAVAAAAPEPLVADRDLRDTRVDLALRAGSWREAVAAVAAASGCVVEQREGWTLLRRDARVSYRCQDRDARVVLRDLARAAQRSLVIAPDVRGRVDVELEDIPWAEALEQVASQAGLTLTQVGACAVVSGTPRDPVAAWHPAAFTGSTLSLALRDAPEAELLQRLGAGLETNLIGSEGAEQQVTLHVDAHPASAVLAALSQRLDRRFERLSPGVTRTASFLPVTLEVEDSDLDLILLSLGRYDVDDLVLAPDLPHAQLSALFYGLPPVDGLRAVATAAGLSVARSAGVLAIGRAAPRLPEPERSLAALDAERFDLVCDQRDLVDVAADLARQVGRPVRLGGALHGTLSVALHGVTCSDVARALAARHGWCLREDGADLVLSPGLCLDAFAAPLPEVLRMLAEREGWAAELDPALAGAVTCCVTGASGERLLETLAAIHGFEASVRDGVLRVRPGAGAAPPAPRPRDLHWTVHVLEDPRPALAAMAAIRDGYAQCFQQLEALERHLLHARTLTGAEREAAFGEFERAAAEAQRAIADWDPDLRTAGARQGVLRLAVEAFARWRSRPQDHDPYVQALACEILGLALIAQARVEFEDRPRSQGGFWCGQKARLLAQHLAAEADRDPELMDVATRAAAILDLRYQQAWDSMIWARTREAHAFELSATCVSVLPRDPNALVVANGEVVAVGGFPGPRDAAPGAVQEVWRGSVTLDFGEAGREVRVLGPRPAR